MVETVEQRAGSAVTAAAYLDRMDDSDAETRSKLLLHRHRSNRAPSG